MLIVTFCLALPDASQWFLCDCLLYFVHPAGQHPTFPCSSGNACHLGKYIVGICWTNKRMLSDSASLSYVPSGFVRFQRGQQCEAAERNGALRSERPGPESRLGHLLRAGPQASYFSSLYLTSLHACWTHALLLWIFWFICIFFSPWKCWKAKYCLSYKYRTLSSSINHDMNWHHSTHHRPRETTWRVRDRYSVITLASTLWTTDWTVETVKDYTFW